MCGCGGDKELRLCLFFCAFAKGVTVVTGHRRVIKAVAVAMRLNTWLFMCTTFCIKWNKDTN
jgi:hypothetical protein